MKKCKLCGVPTRFVFNIKLNATPICNDCAYNTSINHPHKPMKPQELSNEELIEHCKYSVKYNVITSDVPYFNQLITRFERITLGNKADEAIKKMEELQQPTLQVGWEYHNGRGEWVQIVKFEKVSKDDEYPYSCSKNNCYASNGLRYAKRGETEHSLILSTGRPIKKEQPQHDEVEAVNICIVNALRLDEDHRMMIIEKITEKMSGDNRTKLIQKLISDVQYHEVEALAREIFVNSLINKTAYMERILNDSFDFANQFITYRNERRAGK